MTLNTKRKIARAVLRKIRSKFEVRKKCSIVCGVCYEVVLTVGWVAGLLALIDENTSPIGIAMFSVLLPCAWIAVFILNYDLADPKGTRLFIELISDGYYEVVEEQDAYVLMDNFHEGIVYGRIEKGCLPDDKGI